MSQKRKTITSPDGTVMRLVEEAANLMVQGGNAKFTTKSKLHSFIKKDIRLSRNENTLKDVKLDGTNNNRALLNEANGNYYALLYKGTKDLIDTKNPTIMEDGRIVPNYFEAMQYQRIVTRFSQQ